MVSPIPSIVYVRAYLLPLLLYLFLQFQVTDTNTTLDPSNAFERKPFPGFVLSLRWEAGLDYIIATTLNQVCFTKIRKFFLPCLLLKVVKVPLEECSSNTDFFSCFAERNPLCGWCVLENKCSRWAQCQNGIRWIPSSDPILVHITPDKYLLHDQQVVSQCIIPFSPLHSWPFPQLNVTVEGPGLPVRLENETYSCHFENSIGRFNITVPAVEVTPGRAYTCDIRDEDIAYDGIQFGKYGRNVMPHWLIIFCCSGWLQLCEFSHDWYSF